MTCVVCSKNIKPGDAMGFDPVHRGNCADRWNNWTQFQRGRALEKSLRCKEP